MIRIRKAEDRGIARFGWLDSRHSFSFGQYYDPAHMGFGVLRVINDDRITPGAGFDTHGHQDMEIITWVLEGGLAHQDSLGNGSVMRPGDVQRMSAGTGILHSEFNASKTDAGRFLQIWIQPDRRGHAPGYAQRHFTPETRQQRLALLVSPDGRDGSLDLHQDVCLYTGLLQGDTPVVQPLAAGRSGWVQVARGRVHLNGQALSEGDGAAITGETQLVFTQADAAELLYFDLPGVTA